MEVTLLGTGSAEGWPNPFCDCASCAAALASGEVRGQSSALVDDRVLLDCGPEVPRAASRAGRDLTGVQTILLTHAHPDHLGPAALLWREWAGTGGDLDVLGPADAIEACRPWLPVRPPALAPVPEPSPTPSPGPGPGPGAGGPRGEVRLRPVAPGETLQLGGYRCRALPAVHEVPTLLWDVEGPDGSSLLYATDTGPLPAATVESLAGRGYDLVLLEETFGDWTDHGTDHLDLVTFPRQLAELRRVAAVDPATRVVAVHLGHRNAPPAELRRRLDAWGAAAGADGDVLTVGHSGRGDRPPRRRTPRRTLVLGGARSGKSREAERLLAAEPEVVYVATSGERADDTEWRERVTAHRARRPARWRTVETTALEDLLASPGPPLLVDCLSLWLTSVLDGAGAWERGRWASARPGVQARVASLVAAWRGTARQVVAVSNEVGSGVVPATWSGRVFQDELGSLNAQLAGESDRVLHVVAGTVTTLRH